MTSKTMAAAVCLILLICLIVPPAWPGEREAVNVFIGGVFPGGLEKGAYADVTVSVYTGDGETVQGLDRDSFRLRQDGQKPLTPSAAVPLAATDAELSVAVVLDNRDDPTTSFSLIRQGAADFFGSLGRRHRGVLIACTPEPRVVAPLTDDVQTLAEKALDLEPVSGSPHVYDGVMAAVRMLLRENVPGGTPGEKAVVLMTDGRSESGLFSFDALASGLLEDNIKLFVIGYGEGDRDTLSPWAVLAEKSGGGFRAAGTRELSPELAWTARRLMNQYVVSYALQEPLGEGRHRLDVTVTTSRGQGEAGIGFSVQNSSKRGWLLRAIEKLTR